MARLRPLALLILVPLLAHGDPARYQVRPGPLEPGRSWTVSAQVRVNGEGGDRLETDLRYTCAVLRRDGQGRLQVQWTHAPQVTRIVAGGEEQRDVLPEHSRTSWTTPEVLRAEAGALPGAAALLARRELSLGERWTVPGSLPIGGLLPVPLEVTYTVRGEERRGDARLLRVACRGEGQVRAEDGTIVRATLEGSALLDPACVDRPRRVDLGYRFAVEDADGGRTTSRATFQLETEEVCR